MPRLELNTIRLAFLAVALHIPAWADQSGTATLQPDTKTVLQAGATKMNEKDGLKYVWIPPGTFQMGCSVGDAECTDAEKPGHEVTITKGFWMGQTPETQEIGRAHV